MESLGDMAGFSSEEFSGSGTVAIVNAIELVHSLLINFFFGCKLLRSTELQKPWTWLIWSLLTGSGCGASLFMGRVKNFLYRAYFESEPW